MPKRQERPNRIRRAKYKHNKTGVRRDVAGARCLLERHIKTSEYLSEAVRMLRLYMEESECDFGLTQNLSKTEPPSRKAEKHD